MLHTSDVIYLAQRTHPPPASFHGRESACGISLGLPTDSRLSRAEHAPSPSVIPCRLRATIAWNLLGLANGRQMSRAEHAPSPSVIPCRLPIHNRTCEACPRTSNRPRNRHGSRAAACCVSTSSALGANRQSNHRPLQSLPKCGLIRRECRGPSRPHGSKSAAIRLNFRRPPS